VKKHVRSIHRRRRLTNLTPKAAPQHDPIDAPQTSLEMWATGYDHDQAYATQSQSLQLGCLGEVNNDDFTNFTPVQAPPTQWWYPEDVGAGWDGAYSESSCSPKPPANSTDMGLPADEDPTPSASSSSITGSPSHLWHGLTPPVCDIANTGTGSAVYIGSSSGMEQRVMMPGTEPSMETSWGDNAIFEPYVASYSSESTEFQRVRPFLRVTTF
jgi:hypothetical protein